METTMNKPAFPHSPVARRNRQRGVSLMMALMALVAISLAAIALVRAVDTATLISGNLAFRQSTVNIADAGIAVAAQWIADNAGSLDGDQTGYGYYATSSLPADSLATARAADPTGKATPDTQDDDVDWNLDNTDIPSKARRLDDDPTTKTQRAYVITRLCDSPLPVNDTKNHCLSFTGTSPTGGSKQELSYGEGKINVANKVYYQITTRAVGPRNTVSYVQAIVYM
jgi:Tfp pilus assembly protein PilX